MEPNSNQQRALNILFAFVIQDMLDKVANTVYFYPPDISESIGVVLIEIK
jgi:hypothetical protein